MEGKGRLPEGVCGALVCLECLTKHHISAPQHLVHEVDHWLCGVEADQNFPAGLHQHGDTSTWSVPSYRSFN